jgi:hypothetical protein
VDLAVSHPIYRRWRRSLGRWTFETYIDVTCLMIGINWTPPWVRVPGYYLHFGPLIVGCFRAQDNARGRAAAAHPARDARRGAERRRSRTGYD